MGHPHATRHPHQKRRVVVLQKLTTLDRYRSFRNQFGVGRLTVKAVLMQVVRAINTILRNVDPIMAVFAAMGFPNCGTGGRIDSPRPPGLRLYQLEGVPFNGPAALVDHQGWFTNINIGQSGKAQDTHVFRSSSLFQKMHAGTFSLAAPSGSGTWTCIPHDTCSLSFAPMADEALHWTPRPCEGTFQHQAHPPGPQHVEHSQVVVACCVLHYLSKNKGGDVPARVAG
ncbi:uncharacterized protein LOC142823918 [Pelodiscus sinensis]|uniref:uncharacterized protein LOC142823918 n=1 Tax=Pelodiscus sinensis TaxID=13735 RepID=UPI003F6D79E3